METIQGLHHKEVIHKIKRELRVLVASFFIFSVFLIFLNTPESILLCVGIGAVFAAVQYIMDDTWSLYFFAFHQIKYILYTLILMIAFDLLNITEIFKPFLR